MKTKEGVLGLIGNTPLLKLSNRINDSEANIYYKPEYINPSGSIKDRIALHMIEQAEKAGVIKPGFTIVEASTGNTAIAFSFVGTVKGYKVKIYMPTEVCEQEKVKTIELFGAEVIPIDTNPQNVNEKSIHGGDVEIIPRKTCLEMERTQQNTWWARQFSSPDNSGAHRETTGKEILEQTGGNVDAFVASMGTAGTLVGVGQALRKVNPNIKLIGIEPAGTPWMKEGKKGVKVIAGLAGGLLLEALEMVDDVIFIKNDEAVKMANELTRKEGLFCGISSGANILVALRLSQKHPELKNIVTVLPDNRDRYFSADRYTT